MKQTICVFVAAAVLSVAAHAETVYMSAHGKTFHKTTECMSLKRATHVYTAEREAATTHGLHQCTICYREHKAGTASGAASWATESKKAEAKTAEVTK
jgi:hypothetical protein